jgi:hypothetical protein
VIGCDHPLALEWVFNAKRPDALAAGLVHLDGNIMDVHPDQLEVQNYFDITVPKASPTPSDTHDFRVPGWVASELASDGGRMGFFFQTDPNKLNIYDMTLPHPIVSAIKPGNTLLEIFKEQISGEGVGSELAVGSAALMNMFNNRMTGRDQWEAHVVSSIDGMVSFDTMDVGPEMRQEAISKGVSVKTSSLGFYGEKDDGAFIVEPRQVVKENAFVTTNIHRLVTKWHEANLLNIESEEREIRSREGGKYAHAKKSDPIFNNLKERKEEFHVKHNKAMRELFKLHALKLERCFTSPFEAKSIPAGYRACWNGLMAELKDMPSGTANIAMALNQQMTDSDRTVHGHMMNWIGSFFEDDCYVDGRSWPLMQELFVHCFGTLSYT